MKNYEAFFFDVDGTLLDNQAHKIPQSTIKAIQTLKRKGKKCIICSGRGYQQLKCLEGIDFVEWDGYILYNGALAADNQGKTLKKQTFNPFHSL